MKPVNILLLTVLLILIILICFLIYKKKSRENFNSTCYTTQMACLNDCAPVYTYTPNPSNKWIFYNGSISDSLPPTLFFTRYPNNVVEVSSSSTNILNNCSGKGWFYFSLTDGIWKEENKALTEPPTFISNLVTEKRITGFNPNSRPTLKTSSEFLTPVTHNGRSIGACGLATFTPQDGKLGSASPNESTCCPSLIFYLVNSIGDGGWDAGSGTSFTIPPFVGRYKSGV